MIPFTLAYKNIQEPINQLGKIDCILQKYSQRKVIKRNGTLSLTDNFMGNIVIQACDQTGVNEETLCWSQVMLISICMQDVCQI